MKKLKDHILITSSFKPKKKIIRLKVIECPSGFVNPGRGIIKAEHDAPYAYMAAYVPALKSILEEKRSIELLSIMIYYRAKPKRKAKK